AAPDAEFAVLVRVRRSRHANSNQNCELAAERRVGADRARAPQRWSMAAESRAACPVYTCRGRPILVAGGVGISRHWAIQPGVRPMANSGVNMFVGKPMAL